MGSTPWSIDINDEFQPLYNDLWEVLYNAIVRDWEERRRLKVSEKCIRRKWRVIIGNSKSNTTEYIISTESEWIRLHSRIRQMVYYGDKKAQERATTV